MKLIEKLTDPIITKMLQDSGVKEKIKEVKRLVDLGKIYESQEVQHDLKIAAAMKELFKWHDSESVGIEYKTISATQGTTYRQEINNIPDLIIWHERIKRRSRAQQADKED